MPGQNAQTSGFARARARVNHRYVIPRITPDPAFTAALESRLRRAHRAQLNARPSWLPLRPRLAYVFTLALLLSLLIGIPVLAQMGMLKYFVPIETTQWPWPHMTPMPFNAVEARDLAELEKAVGFALRMPTYLPNDCALLQYQYIARDHAAFLSYACVDILEQWPHGDWRNTPWRQPVGPHAVQTLTINGQPAYYIEGPWQFQRTRDGTRTPPVWVPSGARRLVFERGDVLIDLAAIPESISNGVVAGLISKEELIRIAESMK